MIEFKNLNWCGHL